VTPAMKYLEVHFVAGLKFKFNPDPLIIKCMGAFNTIYGRIGYKDSIDIVISLLCSVCAPTLMYGTKLIGEIVAVVDKLLKSYDKSFMKIFSTFDKNTVRLCQYYTGILPMNYQIDLKPILFLRQLTDHPDRKLFQLL